MVLIHSKKPLAFKSEVEVEAKKPVSIENPEAEPTKTQEMDESPETELHEMLGSELMDAIHSKDPKKLMSGIEAMVLSCLNKKED